MGEAIEIAWRVTIVAIVVVNFYTMRKLVHERVEVWDTLAKAYGHILRLTNEVNELREEVKRG